MITTFRTGGSGPKGPVGLNAEPIPGDKDEIQSRGLKHAKNTSPEGLYLIDSDRSK